MSFCSEKYVLNMAKYAILKFREVGAIEQEKQTV